MIWKTVRLPATPPDVSDLVSVAEIATRAGRPVNTIQSWRRRYGDFPDPVAKLAAGPIWNWPTIAHWISARGATPRVAADRPGLLG